VWLKSTKSCGQVKVAAENLAKSSRSRHQKWKSRGVVWLSSGGRGGGLGLHGGCRCPHARESHILLRVGRQHALTNPRGAARAPVGNLTSSLVECVPLVKEVACLVLGSSDGIALATFRTVPGYPSVLPGLNASEPTDCKEEASSRRHRGRA
jgi:hypothetical protein